MHIRGNVHTNKRAKSTNETLIRICFSPTLVSPVRWGPPGRGPPGPSPPPPPSSGPTQPQPYPEEFDSCIFHIRIRGFFKIKCIN